MKDEYVIWKYVEKKPLPSYLVSVVIGTFSLYESKYRERFPLLLLARGNQGRRCHVNFFETPQMLKFFEEYFETNYPFKILTDSG